MKVYKAYRLLPNGEKYYLKNQGGTEIFSSVQGIKSKISGMRKYTWYKDAKFYIEEYDCVLAKEIEL